MMVFNNYETFCRQLLYSYNPSHVVIGGDMNVDFNRSSPHTRILTDFIEDFNLHSCGDLPIASVLLPIQVLLISQLKLIIFLFLSHYIT